MYEQYLAFPHTKGIRIHSLKMLGLYLYTLIIGHKCYNMLSILNKLTLQNKLQNFETKNVFLFIVTK